MNQENSTTQKGNPFRWVLPLQHMASVKIVEVLWRNSTTRHKWKYSDVKSELESLHFQLMCEENVEKLFNPDAVKRESHFQLMCDSLEENVKKLPVPDAIKDELQVFVIEMVNVAQNWLKIVSRDLKEICVDEHYSAIIAHFVDNFSWENNGLADGRRMFQSYVSNKETITCNIWRSLCEYCIEDDIIRFSDTIDDWRNCFLRSSHHAIYSYWMIYGKCPTREMFASDGHYSSFKDSYYRSGQFDENKFMKHVLEKSASCSFPAGIAAVKYFHNQPEYKVELDDILRRKGLIFSCESFVYMLEEMKDTEQIKEICSFSTELHPLFMFSTCWPWNMFADRWMTIFEERSVLPGHFFDFFQNLCESIRDWGYYELRESQYKIVCNRTLYSSFKEVWACFKERFGVDNDAARNAFIAVFGTNDIALCKLLFDDVESSQRLGFLRTLGDPDEELVMDGLSNDDFCNKFSEEVLKDDEERGIFQGVLSSRHLEL